MLETELGDQIGVVEHGMAVADARMDLLCIDVDGEIVVARPGVTAVEIDVVAQLDRGADADAVEIDAVVAQRVQIHADALNAAFDIGETAQAVPGRGRERQAGQHECGRKLLLHESPH